MNLQEELQKYQYHSAELAKVIQNISSCVIVSRSKRIDIIQRCVCEMLCVPLVAMQSSSRKAHLVQPRWIAYEIARDLTAKSFEEIATNFREGTNHGTVMYGISELRKRCSVDAKLSATVAEVKAECRKRLDAHAMPLFEKPKKTKTQ